jgi:hypothetical protein
MAESTRERQWPPEAPYDHAAMCLDNALVIIEGATQRERCSTAFEPAKLPSITSTAWGSSTTCSNMPKPKPAPMGQ